MTFNSIKAVAFRRKGETVYAPVSGGVARQIADEDGYEVSLADSCIWLPEALLRQARAGIGGGVGVCGSQAPPCCASYSSEKHAGPLRCGRRADCPVEFDNGPRDIEDVLREGAGEIVDSREARAAIGKKTAQLFKTRLRDSLAGR